MSASKPSLNRRILIIDDNERIHDDFRKVLGDQTQDDDPFEAKLLGVDAKPSSVPSFDLQFASQGQDGADLVERAYDNDAPIALAFVDIRMPPGWDGVKTIGEIWRRDPRVQIAICTAYSDHTCEEISEKFHHTDQLLFIRKPFDSIEIFQIAAALVNKWNVTQDLHKQLDSLEDTIAERASELEKAYIKQREMEAQLNQAQKMEAVGRLTGGVAHDFNNLLTVVLGYLDCLTEDPSKFSKDDCEKLLAIKNAAQSAAQLTQQLLAFSRQQVTQLEIFDLNELLNKLNRMLERIISENIVLKIDTATEPLLVKADRVQIEQVIMNLVVNAKDAIEGANGKLHIETFSANKDDRTFACIRVTDNGKGMSEETLPKIFEPFFTTKSREKGTGLGLSTAYGIMSNLRGSIEVVSKPNAGASFTLYFPISTEVKTDKKEASSPSVSLKPSALKTVLLVEDEEEVRRLASYVLKKAGYEIIEASDGQQAFDLLQSDNPTVDLLLTDVIMPRMGGEDLAKNFAKFKPSSPILFMSGYTGQGSFWSEHGADINFIQKPFSTADLLKKVKSVIDVTEQNPH